MLIRQEKSTDYYEIYNLVKTAFETAPVKDGDEQDFVNHLRASDKYIPKLALVAEKSKSLIEHIMLTKTQIKCDTKSCQELLLAPLCVEISNRNNGVGAMLVKESFRLAVEMGYTAVFVVGDPLYYSRFGFTPTSNFGITNNSDIPQKYVMACELLPDSLKNKEGIICIV